MTRDAHDEEGMEPRSEELSALLRDEPSRPGPSSEDRSWLDAHVGVIFSAPPPPPAPPAAPLPVDALPVALGAAKLAWPILALTVAVGGALAGLALRAERTEPVRVPLEAPSPMRVEPAAHPPMPAPAAGIPSPRRAAALPAPRVNPAVARPAPHEQDDSLAQEQKLIERVQDALAAGAARVALDHLDELAARFPNGVLVEERDLLRVVTLVQLGEHERAKALAESFRAARPQSVFLPALDETIREPGPR